MSHDLYSRLRGKDPRDFVGFESIGVLYRWCRGEDARDFIT